MNLLAHEENMFKKQMPGRTVTWVQTPETTGGQYSSICITVYEPGARAKPAHAHDNGEETIYVVSGSGRAKVGKELFELRPGSVLLFPQEVPHMVWNTGDEPLKLACFYAPQLSAIEYTFYEDFDFDEFKGQVVFNP